MTRFNELVLLTYCVDSEKLKPNKQYVKYFKRTFTLYTFNIIIVTSLIGLFLDRNNASKL